MNASRLHSIVSALAAAGALASAAPAAAQWSSTFEQFYLPAKHNWAFRDNYRAADRLFNAFDYGHAILYETLYRKPDAPSARLEVDEYDFITKRLLVKPPRVPLEENAIEVEYAKLVPEAKQMFDWAHILHRQIYDVWADESIPEAQKDAKIAELMRYYKSRPDLAFSSQPKTMELMEGQYYSTAFREKYPKFNGLIWAYHWLQVGLYEPLIVGRTPDERQTGVTAAVARFWQMLERPPGNMPRLMPMTAVVAPGFARRYPEAAIIFDNLHSMHDVVSDILISPKVPRDKKRQEILTAAARYRDDTSFVMSENEWRAMAAQMGVQNMGGLATGFLSALPQGTVARGASMAGMDHDIPGMRAADTTHVHGAMQKPDSAAVPRDTAAAGTLPPDHMRLMMELHSRMMGDSVVVVRLIADSAMHRVVMQMIERMPQAHRELMMRLMSAPTHRHEGAPPTVVKPTPADSSARRPAAAGAGPTDGKAPAVAPAKPADPHAGHAAPIKKPVKADTIKGGHQHREEPL